MLGVIGKILGSEKVIESGLKLIDDMHTSTEEEVKAKADAKTQTRRRISTPSTGATTLLIE